MRNMLRVLVLVVAGCATARQDASPCIDVQSHMYEVPRNPYPGYRPDGVVITRLDGESAWTKAGLLVNDVIETVNGEGTLDAGSFRKAVGDRNPRKVRIAGSRAGPVGQYRIVAIEVS